MKPEEIDKVIKKYDPNVRKGSKEFQAYRVLLGAAVTGAFERKILDFWGSDSKGMTPLIRNAFQNGIFHKSGKLDAEIYTDRMGMALGAATLLGYLRRTRKTQVSRAASKRGGK